jgi:two-component system phosphate regulon sensor histidine kinase PhoR
MKNVQPGLYLRPLREKSFRAGARGIVTARIFFRLIAAVACVLVIALVAADWLASRVTERAYVAILARQAEQKARVLALTIGGPCGGDVRALSGAAAARITCIDKSGRVLADSEGEPSHMENHASRPEVRAALEGHAGSDTRRSTTVGVKFLYAAVPLGDHGAIRLAIPLRDIQAQVRTVTRQVLVAVFVAFLPAVLIAALFARVISRKLAAIIEHAVRLAQGDFESRLPITHRDELDVLSEQLNKTGERLQVIVRELENEHEKLERLERVRKDFIINVSHELRTPLASILGYTETLLDGALEDPRHNVRFLNIIRTNSERLGRLVGDLMTLSRLELKQTTMSFALYPVNELICDCVDSMMPVADKAKVNLRAEPADPGTDVYGDSEAVHQILINLLDNAIKYTHEGGSVTVRARVEPEYVRVLVDDTGIGVPAEDLPRLFERFYRVDKARSRELGGTGLGLAIVKHLVLANGGQVSVESVPGKGSTFSFTLRGRPPETPGGEDTHPKLMHL